MTSNNTKSILEPLSFIEYALGDRMPYLKDYHTALFCFDLSIYKKLKKIYRGSIFSGLTGELYLMENKICLAGEFGIGCPATIAFFEELASCGIKRFVGVGSAGALHNIIKPGDVVICSGAFSDEGTSAHYPGHKFLSKPSLSLITQIARRFKEHHFPFVKGKSWTTDAPYRETKQKLEYFLTLGADVIEMESSAMFNVARFHKVVVANVFVVGDSISDGKWKPDFKSPDIKKKSLLVSKEIVKFLSDNSI
jgi:uridine phosphorylase